MASLAHDHAASPCKHPRWSPVEGGFPTGIFINNSLTNARDELVTIERNHVKFYMCGPTVYNFSHLGHARAYLTFDIIRGILEDFFSLDVTYVMNITDIDDKIILRGRQLHLRQEYMRDHPVLDAAMLADLAAAQAAAVAKAEGKLVDLGELKTDEDKSMATLLQKQLDGARALLAEIETASTEAAAGGASKDASSSSSSSTKRDDLLAKTKDSLSVWLDGKFGDEVNDNEVFMRFARRFEDEFMRDMEDLGVRPPTALTRISEYVPEVVTFVERIIANGFAYESNGSVYFDTVAYKASGHNYRKLSPASENDNMKAVMAESEGALGNAEGASEKKHEYDFALWKKSKPGEPIWGSPWGEGRPGWHIECSAMGMSIFDQGVMDIHGGGVDLKFPHHDNEMAQNEACIGCTQSVNYFMHAGHLHIAGLKMSKSLKNFTTIRKGLETYSANQIRLLFLVNAWDAPMNFSEDQLAQSKALEKQFHEFFQNIKVVLRDQEALPAKRWARGAGGEKTGEQDLWEFLSGARQRVDAALRDNFNTREAMNELQSLAIATTAYMKQNVGNEQGYLLIDVAKFVGKVLGAFGVVKRDFGSWMRQADSSNLMVQMYTGSSQGGGAAGGAGADREAVVTPLVKILSGVRDQIRALAAGKSASKQDLFALSDMVREQLMYEGVRLEDREGGQRTGWKFEDAAQLRAQMEAEKKEKADKAAVKAAKKAAAANKPAQPAPVHPKEMYKPGTKFGDDDGKPKYSAWNEEGIPTHLADGQELAAKKQKKLLKAQASQAKKFAKWEAKQ
jgi:cysteinyl-tRNA synthetase